jgi:hypothetical protein
MSKPSKNLSVSSARFLEELKDYGLTLVISGAVGALVALPFCLRFGVPLASGALQGCLAGALIGFVSRTGFVLVQKHLSSRPFWAFAFIFLAIGGGTLAGGLIFGLTGVLPLVLLIGLAEAAGLTVTFLRYRYGLVLNRKLRALQSKIQSEIEKNGVD